MESYIIIQSCSGDGGQGVVAEGQRQEDDLITKKDPRQKKTRTRKGKLAEEQHCE